MKCGVCEHCGDTYELPNRMINGAIYRCLKCGKLYKLKIISMDRFVFNRLKNTRM